MSRSAHRRPQPHRVVPQRAAPQRAAPQRRLYGLHKNGFKLRGGHLKHDRRYLSDHKHIRSPEGGHVHLPISEFAVLSHSFEPNLDEPNLDGAHFDGMMVNGGMMENEVRVDNLATPSQATQTRPLENQALAKQDGRQLADLILQRIQTRLSGRIRNLEICITDNSVELTGECRTYYTKQMAQHVAMGVLDYQQLVNNILVC